MLRFTAIFATIFLLSTPVVAADGAPTPADAREQAVRDLIDLGREDAQVMEVLHHLVNVIGSRLTSSHNDHVACEWAMEQFESFGLQNIVMEEAGEFPVAFHRGPWSGKLLGEEGMALEFGTPAWSAGTRGTQTGPAMLPPESTEGADASAYAGAWILMNDGRGGRLSREERQAARAARTWLEEAGVAGFITATRNQYIQTLGNARVTWDELPTTPNIYLLKDHFDLVKGKIDAGDAPQLQFDIRNHFEKGPAKFYNVYGDIVGTEFPDEHVVIGGHIDSWDGATGTTDNGCGSAVTIEVARLLTKAGIKPRRTIRFMLWSGEEQGLLGSKAYCDKYSDLMEKTSACLVYDGGPNVIASLPTTEAMHPQMEEAFRHVFDLNPEYPFELKMSSGGLPRSAGSDHASFLRYGVPGFFWDQEGRADTWHGIHTQFDTYDLAIPEYLEHSTLVVALAALGIADLDGMLDRTGMGVPGDGGGRGGRRLGVFLDGLVVEGVVPDSPAEAAGVKAGDEIVKIDGKELEGRRSLGPALREGGPEKPVVVKRDGKMVDLRVVWPDEVKALEEQKKEEAAKKEKIVL
ncbi:MAG: M20/M25/M40 family metallo-hydrolase [Planctomycetota bacterium]|jgi:carboxypeptidase Q